MIRAGTAVAALCLLAVAACADTAEPAAAPTPTTAATSATSAAAPTTTPPPPTPSPTLDPKTACVRATNLVATATTDLIGEFVDHPDGSTIDMLKLSSTIAEMEAVQPSMPERLGDDLGDLITPLQQLQEALTTGVNRTIETGIYRSRGPGLIIACGRYTKP